MSRASKSRVVSTTEGRQRLPGLIQDVYGDKVVIAFGRYGRLLGALVPIEAVRLLAGLPVDADVEKRVRWAAVQCLAQEKAEDGVA